ncbi:MAG: cytochrome c peroxidase, partial [Paracoccaceae bacterium]
MRQTIAYLFLVALFASVSGGTAFAEGDRDVDPPLAPLPPVPEPLDNRITDAKAELGKLLFFDPKLTGDASLACADCHNPKTGWGT